MYCTNCGLQYLDDSKFCSMCGKPVQPAENNEVLHTKALVKDAPLSESWLKNIKTPGGLVIIILLGIAILYITPYVRDARRMREAENTLQEVAPNAVSYTHLTLPTNREV